MIIVIFIDVLCYVVIYIYIFKHSNVRYVTLRKLQHSTAQHSTAQITKSTTNSQNKEVLNEFFLISG